MHFVIYLIRSSIVLMCSIATYLNVFIEYTEIVAKQSETRAARNNLQLKE